MRTPGPADTSPPYATDRGPARHIVDRALDYARLESQGLTAAQIARRRRKSKGYVSIALRLGRALGGLAPEELAVFRCDRVTWRVAQRVVRQGVSDDAVLRQLRYAVGGFSTLNVDRRKHRVGRRKETFAASGAPVGTGSSPEPLVWFPDPAWAEREPEVYLDAYLVFLGRLHDAVTRELRDALAKRVAGAPATSPLPLAGQSLRQLLRASAAGRRGEPRWASAASHDPVADRVRGELARLSAVLDEGWHEEA